MTSFPDFGDATTATEVTNAFSEQIKGKNVLLVGVSPNSLGEYMAVAISRHSPSNLILASRTLANMTAVINKIHALTPSSPTKIHAVHLDLSSQASIRQAAKEISSLTDRLDVIINNAALNVMGYETTKEGIEMHFGTNHLGLFLITNLLLPSVLRAASSSPLGSARIVNLSSEGHRLSPIRFSDYDMKRLAEELPEEERPPKGLPKSLIDSEKAYSPYVAYGQSKTGNILMSISLTAKLGEKGVRSFSVHPGSIWTGLSRHLDEEGKALIASTGKVWKSGDQGAATAIVAAFDPKLNDVPGGYMADCQLSQPAEYATDPKSAERLWTLSEELVGQKFELSAN